MANHYLFTYVPTKTFPDTKSLRGVGATLTLITLAGCANLNQQASVEECKPVAVASNVTPPQESSLVQTAPLASVPREEVLPTPEPLFVPRYPSMGNPTSVPSHLPPGKIVLPKLAPPGSTPKEPPKEAVNKVTPAAPKKPKEALVPKRTAAPKIMQAVPVPIEIKPPSTASLPVPVHKSSTSSNTGVVALLGKADDQAASGKVDSAAANLERALHIEPENGRLWHELATLQLRQGKAGAAIATAQKSISKARNQKDLQARNWRLISVAYQKKGQSQAAAEALLRARALEGSK
ncbi:hypothetical protein CCP3SC1AL1_4670001 [Gammaproteobacteria bacterium]